MTKKILFLPVIVFLMGIVGCSKNDNQKIIGQGEAEFNIENSFDISVLAKTTSQAPGDYSVVITNTDNSLVVFNKTYSELGISMVLPAANYIITAESCTQNDAQTVPDERGQLRLAGSTAFAIKSATITPVNFTCFVANAKVSVGYSENFKSVFSDFSVEIYEASDINRKLIYSKEATMDTELGYFNLGSKSSIIAKVSATRNDGVKIPDAIITVSDVDPAEWHKLTFNVGTSQGQGRFDIICDEKVTTVESTHDIDPYS